MAEYTKKEKSKSFEIEWPVLTTKRSELNTFIFAGEWEGLLGWIDRVR